MHIRGADPVVISTIERKEGWKENVTRKISIAIHIKQFLSVL